MGYPLNVVETQATSATSTYTQGVGPHKAGNVLLAFAAQDGGTGTLTPPTGWTAIGTQAAGGGVRSLWAWKEAASAAETAVWTSTISDEWTGCVMVFDDLDVAALLDGTPAKVDTTTQTTQVGGTLTTASAGSLLLTGFAQDSAATERQALCKINDAVCLSKASMPTTGVCHAVAMRQLDGAGLTTAITAYLNTSSSGQSWTIALKNKSGGARAPDLRAACSELRWYGQFGSFHDAPTTWEALGVIDKVTAGSFAIGTQYSIQSVGTTDFTLIGAASNTVGVVFTATGAGTGTGTATPTIGGLALQHAVSHGSGNILSLEPWGQWSGLTSLDTYLQWSGGTHAIGSTDFTGKIISVSWARSADSSSAYSGSEGIAVLFSDGTNWAAYKVASKDLGWLASAPQTAFIDPATATPFATKGSINWSAVTRIAYLFHRGSSGSTSHSLYLKNLCLWGATAIVGGGANRPANWIDYQTLLTSWNGKGWATLQGSSQVLAKTSIKIGNGGTNQTYFDSSETALAFPPAWSAVRVPRWQMDWHVGAGGVSIETHAGANDSIALAAGVCASDVQQGLTINAGSSTSAPHSFAGMSFVGFLPTLKTGINPSNATFSRCGEIDAKGADLADCTIKKTTSADAAIAFSEDGGSLTRCPIDVTGTSAAYHLELGTAVTAITLADVTFSGTPATDKVHVRYPETTVAATATVSGRRYKIKTAGTTDWTLIGAANNNVGTEFTATGVGSGTGDAYAGVVITTSGTTSLVAGDITKDAVNTPVHIAAPVMQRGLQFTGLVAGSFVRVVKNSDESQLFVDTNSSTTETWDDATAGSLAVSYMVMKAGYEPIGPISVTVTGAEIGGIQSVPVSQVPARWYQAASGLTLNTNAFANAATKKFGLTVASTGQNFASYLLEQWIAGGGTGGAFANKPWPLQANGPDSFTWLNGWEADTTTYPNTIANLSRDGMRYLDAGGTMTAAWAAILTSGVPAGARVRYRQADGGTTQAAAVASGNMDQLVQIYGDASHGNFDYRGYLHLKVQEAGFDEAVADAVAIYGALEDKLYVVGLAPAGNGLAAGDPGITGVSITDHGATPVSWKPGAGANKDYSITITDAAINSGQAIMRWLRHFFEQGGTFEGKDGFCWHDLVQRNGETKFKSVRGAIYGDVGSALKGVRVLRGANPHPDFDLFTADDGSTAAPPAPPVTLTVAANVSLVGATVSVFDLDNSPAGSYGTLLGSAAPSASATVDVIVAAGNQVSIQILKAGYFEANTTYTMPSVSATATLELKTDPNA